jgi:2-desacetyl-2-hydroxyethyl bacteriochlorophyllide A dehydrogenase
MQAISCAAPGRLEFVDIAGPVRRPGEVLVRMRRMGVCGTDMHIYGGRQPFFDYPRIIGHELSGEVAEADAASGLAAGDIVYINPYLACGSCHACGIGKTNCCMRLKVLGVHVDGGLTGYLSLPRANVVRADGIDVDAAAMVEFLAVGAHAVARSGVRAGQTVLVAGGGPIGVGVALFASLAGARVTVADMRPERLAFCAENLGVDTLTVTPDVTETLRERTNGVFYEAVFDATGSPKSIETQFAHVASGGTYVIVSVVKDNITFSDPEFHRRELTLRASRNALPDDFERVTAAMRAGQVPTGKLNTHRVSFADLPTRMPSLIDPASGVIKALVEIA